MLINIGSLTIKIHWNCSRCWPLRGCLVLNDSSSSGTHLQTSLRSSSYLHFLNRQDLRLRSIKVLMLFENLTMKFLISLWKATLLKYFASQSSMKFSPAFGTLSHSISQIIDPRSLITICTFPLVYLPLMRLTYSLLISSSVNYLI